MKTPIQFTDDLYTDTINGQSMMDLCTKKFCPWSSNRYCDRLIEDGDSWFVGRDDLPRFLSSLPKNCPSITVVTQHSDYEVDESIARIKPSSVVGVFGPNTTYEGIGFNPLPLGLGPHYLRNDTVSAKNFLEVDTRKDRSGLLYVNFRPGTYQQERKPLLDRFADMYLSGQTWIGIGSIPLDARILTSYMNELTSHMFALCPRGNGIDTHRLWECLYSRTIPVVKYHPAHRDFGDLPILFVNDWSEVTEDFLHMKYDEFSTRDWDYSKLRASWWGDRFNLRRATREQIQSN